MKHKPNSMQILIAVNCAALCLLAFVELTPPAGAQAGRTRGTYTAATGRIPGTETFALYVVDETTQELIAVQWDPRAKPLQGLGYRTLATDMGDVMRPRGN